MHLNITAFFQEPSRILKKNRFIVRSRGFAKLLWRPNQDMPGTSGGSWTIPSLELPEYYSCLKSPGIPPWWKSFKGAASGTATVPAVKP